MPSKHAGTARTFRFSPEELELLERVAKRHPSAKAALIAGLRREDGANATHWPAELRRLAAELETSDRSIPLGKGLKVKG